MTIKWILCAFAIATANAALFETYYSSDRSDEPIKNNPAAQPPFNVGPPPQTSPRQDAGTAPRAVSPTPRQEPSPRAPFRTRRLAAAPHGSFALGGAFLLRASVGFASLDRQVSVDTLGGGEAVYYRPENAFMGYSNGATLKHNDQDARWRYQFGVGYQLPNEGNFWYLDYANSDETQELDASFAFSLPSARVANTIPYIKIGANIGFGDSRGAAPSSFGVLLGVGGYNYLNDAKSFRIEYGVDYSRTEWLPISHRYGDEEWIDNLWHIYLGAAYRF
ncbi:MAG: hypothetical protein LBI57_01230 [Helicobacteraceae bacterium]|jgi:hypothetical protein|nr:hypothetical protein [Helicobacteraceae bacterium]